MRVSQGHLYTLGQFDFLGLANLSKHVNHLKEACDALLETITALERMHTKYYMRHPGRTSVFDIAAVEDAFEHKHSLIVSIVLQISSLEKRVSNLTNLVRIQCCHYL